MRAEMGGGSVKRYVLVLILLAVTGLSSAEPTTPAASSDSIFWWMAGGISRPRIERLTQDRNSTCRVVTACSRLSETSSGQSRQSQKMAAHTACSCSSPAAQIAAFVSAKKYDAA